MTAALPWKDPLATDQWRPLNDAVFVPAADPIIVNAALLDALEARALALPGGVCRVLLHGDPSETMQEMVIATRRGRLWKPTLNDRCEKTFLCLRGALGFALFGAEGEPEGALRADAGAAVRFRAPRWHASFPLSPVAVFKETLLGPHEQTTFAPWAPDPMAQTADAAAYRAHLLSLFPDDIAP